MRPAHLVAAALAALLLALAPGDAPVDVSADVSVDVSVDASGQAPLFPCLLGPKAALAAGKSVYDGQGDMTEEELLRFTRHLPEFRAYASASGETAHPTTSDGRPDFTWSEGAAQWARGRGWEPARFFVVMGRTAAAIVLIAEGEAAREKYRDMPEVSERDRRLVTKHLGEVLKAGADPGSR